MALNFLNGDDHFARAHALHMAGRLTEAIPFYEAAIRANPQHRWALNNLAAIAIQTGQQKTGIELLQRLLEIDPQNADAYNAMGEGYRGLRMPEEALACYDKAIALNPAIQTAHNNRGILLTLIGRSADAVESWKKALALAGESPGTEQDRSLAHNNLGNAYLGQGDIARALEHHQRACDLAPGNPIYHSNLLRGMTHGADIAPQALRTQHATWWEKHAAGIIPMEHARGGDPERKLKIGLLSPDFREHSVTYFLMDLLEHFDRDRFEFFSYSNTAAADAFTQKVAGSSTAFRNIVAFTDEQAAQLIRDDRIDILLDLAGHTADHRLRVLAYKPAPVQATYLGYPQTTGGSLVDWRITDAIADPPGMTDAHFVERSWRLPRCAWCYRPPVEIAAEATSPATRGEPFTFASFNNYSKVTDRVIALWARVLQAVPQSRLLLKATTLRDETICNQARSRFAAVGIGPDRIAFSGKQSTTEEHLAIYRQVDLALDTFPYDGTTTTCEALWMNVPVITLEGTTHASRVGTSLLTAIGLPELIAKNEDEYVAIAARLAAQMEELVAMRKGLRARMEQSPLMDGRGFARDFCEALRGMWREHVTR